MMMMMMMGLMCKRDIAQIRKYTSKLIALVILIIFYSPLSPKETRATDAGNMRRKVGELWTHSF